MSIELTLFIMFVCLLLEGFFSGSEIAIVSADKIKLRHQAAKGSRGAILALEMLHKPEWLLSTTLVGTNLALITNTTLATGLSLELVSDQVENAKVYAALLTIFVVTPIIWIFGEIVPKSIFQQHANQVTPVAIFALRFFAYLFAPILFIFGILTRFLLRLFGKELQQNPFTLREEILSMLQMPNMQQGDIQTVEKNMIQRLFEFSSKQVKEVMVPLIDVIAIEKNANCEQALSIAHEHSHVRLPVYDQRIDKIVGILDMYRCLGLQAERPIKSQISPVRYVYESKDVSSLLQELRHSSDTFAVVVDEFGGAQGIITLEDIMEEVVEEIEDEYDTPTDDSQWFKILADNDYLVNARIELDVLQTQLEISLPDGLYTTLAGFLLNLSGAIPPEGEVIEAAGYHFTIRRCTPQLIQEVQIQRMVDKNADEQI